MSTRKIYSHTMTYTGSMESGLTFNFSVKFHFEDGNTHLSVPNHKSVIQGCILNKDAIEELELGDQDLNRILELQHFISKAFIAHMSDD